MAIVTSNTTCFHCGEACSNPSLSIGDKSFCCSGCKSVFQLLHQHELDDYYCMNEQPGLNMPDQQPERFQFLDDPAIASSILSFQDGTQAHVTLYLPQIHCSSCLWLLENLQRLHPAIITAQVNFATKELSVAYLSAQFSLRELATLLSSIGYEPHISPSTATEVKDKKQFSSRKAAYKLGITGFCFANIMLISFPEYLGMQETDYPQLSAFFRYLNLALSLPVVGYGAREFFVNAAYSFRQRYINIDAPIALAITVTFLRSLYEILSGTGPGYLDSMSGIVFFMLLGRTLQNKTYSTLNFNRDYKSYFPIAVSLLKEGLKKTTRIEEIKENDILLIHHQEVVPTDGILSKGKAEIDYSFVTGESQPVTVTTGNIIYAGGKNKGTMLEIVAVKSFSQNSFTRLWNNKAFDKIQTDKKKMTTLISRYFSAVVLLIAFAAFLFWQAKEPAHAWNALTAVLIVACPCALLLTSSFTNGYLMAYFASQGFFLKNAGVIEAIAKVNHIAFDKTGTITEASPDKVSVKKMALTPEELEHLLSVLSQSIHPLSQSIAAHYTSANVKYPVVPVREIAGKGIEAWIEDQYWKIGSAGFVGIDAEETPGSTEVYVSVDDSIKAHFLFSSRLRPGIRSLLPSLQQYTLSLISGDNENSRQQMEQLFPKGADLLYQQTPEDKLEHILQLQSAGKKVLMIGDGLNDAGALQQSNAGIAMVQHSFSFSPAADAIMKATALPELPRYLRFARLCKNLILAGFAYSLLFNIIGIAFAVTARLSPMIAAILMPSSSLGIMLIAFAGIQWITRTPKVPGTPGNPHLTCTTKP